MAPRSYRAAGLLHSTGPEAAAAVGLRLNRAARKMVQEQSLQCVPAACIQYHHTLDGGTQQQPLYSTAEVDR
jgi:hypothetical protein